MYSSLVVETNVKVAEVICYKFGHIFLSNRDEAFEEVELNESEGCPVEEREEEVDDVDGGEEDVDDEVAGVQLAMAEDRDDCHL